MKRYNAPAAITKSLIVVVRGNISRMSIGGNSYDVFSGSKLSTVSAVVQLIPGKKIINSHMVDTYTIPVKTRH